MKQFLLAAVATIALVLPPIQAEATDFATFSGPNFSLVYPSTWKKHVDKTGVVTLACGENGYVSFNPAKVNPNANLKQMLQGLKSELGSSLQNTEMLNLLENALNQPNPLEGMSNDELKELMGDDVNAGGMSALDESLLPTMTQLVVEGILQEAATEGLLTQADLANKPTCRSGTEKLGGLEVSKSWAIVNRPNFYLDAETLYTAKKGFPLFLTVVAKGKNKNALKQVTADIETIKLNWEWKR